MTPQSVEFEIYLNLSSKAWTRILYWYWRFYWKKKNCFKQELREYSTTLSWLYLHLISATKQYIHLQLLNIPRCSQDVLKILCICCVYHLYTYNLKMIKDKISIFFKAFVNHFSMQWFPNFQSLKICTSF